MRLPVSSLRAWLLSDFAEKGFDLTTSTIVFIGDTQTY